MQLMLPLKMHIRRALAGRRPGMKLRLVYSGSQGGGCPTVYETDQGDDVVVQGDLVTDPEALGDLKDVLAGEGAVLLPRSVILEAARRMTS
jgi:hypothetical protein